MLADARHDETIPPEVATRLDAALADLAPAAADAPAGEAAVVPLRSRDDRHAHEEPEGDAEERRLRRRVSRVLLAAAAVVAIGYGATQVLPDLTQSGGDDAGSTAGHSDKVSQAESGGDSGALDAAPPPVTDLGIAGLRPLDTDDLRQSLTSLRRKSTRSEEFSAAQRDAALDRCGPADPVPGSRLVGASYDGRPAMVVYLPEQNGRQRVELYLCDTAKPRKVFQTVTLAP